MKYKILLLAVFISVSSICYGDPFNPQKNDGRFHLNMPSPQDVSSKANNNPSFDASGMPAILQDPMVNSMLGGFGNYVQGTTGGTYSMQEQMKQQTEYAQQQSNAVEE